MIRNTERNERNTRQVALLLAIAFHLAAAGLLYFKSESEALHRNIHQPSKKAGGAEVAYSARPTAS